MPTIKTLLLVLHIACGSLAVLSGLAAIATKSFRLSHRTHVIAGRAFAWSMLGVFLTAVPLALISKNFFLFLVAILSFYLTLMGWREALRRTRDVSAIDHAAPAVMIIAGAAMIVWGTLVMMRGNFGGIVLLVLGGIGTATAIGDFRHLARKVTPTDRIVHHMVRMTGALISAITAFVVVNVQFSPGWVVWLDPTLAITPVIFILARRIRAGQLR